MAPSLPRAKTSIPPYSVTSPRVRTSESRRGTVDADQVAPFQYFHRERCPYLVQRGPRLFELGAHTAGAGVLLLSSESIVDFNVAAFVGYTEELATVPAGLIT